MLYPHSPRRPMSLFLPSRAVPRRQLSKLLAASREEMTATTLRGLSFRSSLSALEMVIRLFCNQAFKWVLVIFLNPIYARTLVVIIGVFDEFSLVFLSRFLHRDYQSVMTYFQSVVEAMMIRHAN